MDQYAIYLDPVQFRALRAQICRFLRRHPEWRRQSRRQMTLSSRLRLTLLALRHNLKQRLLAALFGLHQSTVCRILAWMRGLLSLVLAPEIPGPGDLAPLLARLLAGGSRPVVLLVDGTLVPVSQRERNPSDYSGKHHRMGKNLQIVSDVAGKLLYVGPALPGRTHDSRAFSESGLAAELDHSRFLVHADRGYLGCGLITPRRSSKYHDLTLAEQVENREINLIRNPVERSIAHLKILDVLRSGIRTRSPHRERVISEVIAVAVGLVFFRQKWPRS